MRKKVFLVTGPPMIGKTTVLIKVADGLKDQGYRVGGMVSQEVRLDGVRVGFEICDYESGEVGWLAHVKQASGPKIGKYRVNLENLDFIGVKAIQSALSEADAVLIDEIGPMELCSKKFVEAVEEAISGDNCVLATIHYRANHPFVRKVKSKLDNRMLVVTRENRSKLPQRILDNILKVRG
jgi:nucleoside-triphosphatase